MGQGSSRNREQQSPGQGNANDAAPEASGSSQPAGEQPRHRRSSVRKSFLNLVKHRSSRSLNGTDESAPSPHSRSWRYSRRWDNATPDPSTVSDSPQDSGPSETQHPPPLFERKDEISNQDPDVQAIELPEVVVDSPTDSIPEDTLAVEDFPTDAVTERPETGEEVLTPSPTLANRLGLSRNSSAVGEEEVVISPNQFPQDLPPLEPIYTDVPTPPPPVPELPSQTPLNRQFPPPGTLVVVQGVVHTTDMPRAQPSLEQSIPTSQFAPDSTRRRASSTPRPSTPAGTERAGARNRLSALLRSRPASMASQRPVSMSSDRVSIPPNPSTSQPVDSSGASDLPSDAAAIGESNTFARPSTETETPPTAAPVSETRSAISSSSIDVLGTLLSVAAAATAASLLTGSSEPMLSSGLQPPPGAGPPFNNPPTEPQIRPMSPTPTAGLGGLETGPGGRTERMRQAWSSIRERLGLRPSGPSMTSPGDGLRTAPSGADGTILDGRERMLAEMARAFNLGLGISSDSIDSNSTSVNATSSGEEVEVLAPPSNPLPPEGSFERFLIDLQIDLRNALTQTAQTPTAEQSTQSSEQEPATGEEQSATQPSEVTPDNTPSLADPDTQGLLLEGPQYEYDSDEEDDESFNDADEVASGTSEAATGNNGEGWNLPPLPSTVSGPNPIPVGPDNPSGRINWWRLYRFPAITTPRPPTDGNDAAAQPTAPSLPTDASPTPDMPPTSIPTPPLPAAPEPGPSTLSATGTDTPSESPLQPPPANTARASPNIVIPVIVVGLQSVNLRFNHPMEDPSDVFGATRSAEPSESSEVDITLPSPDAPPRRADTPIPGDGLDDLASIRTDGRPSSHRGRRWHARAANALRNLRGGTPARPTIQGMQDTEGTGTRTFLIYVIGGYYPPDHSIVTGEPNNLDSFEALMELAELFGQVKPPTVSKEDIEKSGLEVIKATTVPQYETDGKISANCTERCLICLDEYVDDDDVRVMNCRHAFHKHCVDIWLQTGKNNCPACRSKGVSNDGPSPSPVLATEA